MSRVRLRYAVSGLALRLRGIVQFGVYPQGVRQSDAFRSLGRIGTYVSTEDSVTRTRARLLATVLGQSYIRAQLLANSMSRHMGTGRYRPRHIAEADLVRERLTRLSEVDDAWELTFAVARIRDLAAGVPGAGTLVGTLNDAHELARALALSGADFSVRVVVVRLNLLSRLLLSMSVSLLPAEHRGRYGAEFRAELYDLRPSKRRQILYALRQLRYAIVLRRSLRQGDGQAERERRTDT